MNFEKLQSGATTDRCPLILSNKNKSVIKEKADF